MFLLFGSFGPVDSFYPKAALADGTAQIQFCASSAALCKPKNRLCPMKAKPVFFCIIRLIGIEPTHPAPEAGALSTELQALISLDESFTIIPQSHMLLQGGI